MSYIARVTNPAESYGSLTTVDNIPSEIEESEITSLLGPNGAGKTANIQQLLKDLPGNRVTPEDANVSSGLRIFNNIHSILLVLWCVVWY